MVIGVEAGDEDEEDHIEGGRLINVRVRASAKDSSSRPKRQNLRPAIRCLHTFCLMLDAFHI